MSYVTVDPIIHAWVVVNALTLFTEAGGGEARFVYSSSDRGECFQIAIAPPVAGQVVINLWSIETFQDEELEEVLLSSVEDLRDALDTALSKIDTWKARPFRREG